MKSVRSLKCLPLKSKEAPASLPWNFLQSNFQIWISGDLELVTITCKHLYLEDMNTEIWAYLVYSIKCFYFLFLPESWSFLLSSHTWQVVSDKPSGGHWRLEVETSKHAAPRIWQSEGSRRIPRPEVLATLVNLDSGKPHFSSVSWGIRLRSQIIQVHAFFCCLCY